MSTFLVHGSQGVGFEGDLVGKLFGCLSFEGVFWAAVITPFDTVDIKMLLVFKIHPGKVIRLCSKLGVYGKTEKRRRKREEEGEDKEEEDDGAMDTLVASSSGYPCGWAVGGLFPMAGRSLESSVV